MLRRSARAACFMVRGTMVRRTYLRGAEQGDLLTATDTSAEGEPPREWPAETSVLRVKPITPLLRWPGGKSGELNRIRAHMPHTVRNYFEPFIGGGAVFLAIDDRVPAYLNDISKELVDFYAEVAIGTADLCRILQKIDDLWKYIEAVVEGEANKIVTAYLAFASGLNATFVQSVEDLFGQFREKWVGLLAFSIDIGVERLWPQIVESVSNKASRMRKIEAEKGRFSNQDIVDNISGAIKSSIYCHIRSLYNGNDRSVIEGSLRSAIFYFVREYSYAAMFRYNSSGEFNVPYGGISYNRKFMSEKLRHFESEAVIRKFSRAWIEQMDFADFFLKRRPESGDFIFVDPPYDSEFSEYGIGRFCHDDHRRLAQFLLETPANWMLVIKSTKFMLDLYADKGLTIRAASKKYVWTIKERNVRDAIHLMITNY
jgi:DNA adenine methylase